MSQLLESLDIKAGMQLALMDGKLKAGAQGQYLKEEREFKERTTVVMKLDFISAIHAYHPERIIGPSNDEFETVKSWGATHYRASTIENISLDNLESRDS